MSALPTITVAIVEDDPSVGEILAGWINGARGFRLSSRHLNAESALERLPKEKPDIVLTDINLPGMNGIQCVSRLKPILPNTQFVMLTVYEDTDHIFDALTAGATGYLLKQTDREELLASLMEVHKGGSPMSTYIARKVVKRFYPTPAKDTGMARLGMREKQVLEFLAQGYLYKEIAHELQLKLPTINTYVRRIYEKLHVNSRGRAVAIYSRIRGETSPPAKSPKQPE
ncbi:MAG: response regulator transcription factor [Akkermansiaceae bacterium]|nr:response regulator transcription factor [Verrucomicrobiales bacterium]